MIIFATCICLPLRPLEDEDEEMAAVGSTDGLRHCEYQSFW